MAVGHKTAELENCWQVCAWSSIAGGSSVIRSCSGQVQEESGGGGHETVRVR